ncbi:MAG: Methyltransferase [Candidatus Gottesmanbacteria bacterium GW2011_GWA2_47_9]|uniref:Methyltransferase n=1 Tax=Candidatus Gottesmanbacteria bacterium GW2011_GWA2_47_9 TaxID=1618445 RepID=A0A0G1U476_9BACT|nr:MAG: Methyltransferase [Candidatus Gottesmanbacteria bacterium GW2011_GWA2_47_9]
MSKSLNLYGQTEAWEHACVKTRRNLKTRKERLGQFSFGRKDKILDLGCGDGLNLKILWNMGIHHITGVDISKELLKEAKLQVPKAIFFAASAENLPFQPNHFDAVLVDSVFHHLLRYDKALREIRRVLKPGGVLCFLEPHRSLLRSIIDFICLLPIANYIPVLRERSISYKGEIDLMRHWLATEEEFYSWLDRLNMKEVFCRTSLMSKVGKFKKV